MRVLVVLNSAESGPGRLPELLSATGVEPVVVPGPELPATMAEYAGLVLLGGGFLPDDDATHPFLARERALVVEALDAGIPVLGICLGGQLLAHVAGGTVTGRSGETERGMCAVDLLPAAADDPVLGGLAAPVWMVQNHQDSITALPPGATWLATSTACAVQAFRVGESAWGLQFHPEAAADRIATWDTGPLAAEGLDRDALLAAALGLADGNAAQAAALVTAWAEVVRSGRRPTRVGRTGTWTTSR